MADNDTATCDYCGGTLDWRIRPCTQRYEDGHWTASHDDCIRADSNWSQVDAMHRAWCHTEGCNKAPAYPFTT